MKHSKYLVEYTEVQYALINRKLPFAVIWIRVKLKTLVGTEVGFWLWHGWHWYLEIISYVINDHCTVGTVGT